MYSYMHKVLQQSGKMAAQVQDNHLALTIFMSCATLLKTESDWGIMTEKKQLT